LKTIQFLTQETGSVGANCRGDIWVYRKQGEQITFFFLSLVSPPLLLPLLPSPPLSSPSLASPSPPFSSLSSLSSLSSPSLASPPLL
jgi:hypothetical protein